MSRTAIDIEGFEAKFQENPDPWNYATSPFEAHKRRILRLACGNRQYGRVLELACANGETTKVLATICLNLLAVDGSITAVAEARRSTQHLSNVSVACMPLPDGLPRRQFDLIVASEIFYYLKPRDLHRLLARLYQSLAPGGRIVCLHHIVDFDDAASRPVQAQHLANAYFRKRCRAVLNRSYGRFEVSAFEKPNGQPSVQPNHGVQSA